LPHPDGSEGDTGFFANEGHLAFIGFGKDIWREDFHHMG
jgi:hypothetical protein